ncbi:hypothetical protein IJF86_01300 [Candidatus Saccharibacteria bacterium]|nr:hypothetical protein [Candidatus Saccharibacteria bacterium]
MKTKNIKTPARVKVNTGLFVVLAVILGVMTFCGVNKLQMFGRNFRGITDAPALCYDEDAYRSSDKSIIKDTYPCLTQIDEDGNNLPATSQNDHTMFLYNQNSFYGTVLTNELLALMVTVGGMLTLASFVGGIIYWNHNR